MFSAPDSINIYLGYGANSKAKAKKEPGELYIYMRVQGNREHGSAGNKQRSIQ